MWTQCGRWQWMGNGKAAVLALGWDVHIIIHKSFKKGQIYPVVNHNEFNDIFCTYIQNSLKPCTALSSEFENCDRIAFTACEDQKTYEAELHIPSQLSMCGKHQTQLLVPWNPASLSSLIITSLFNMLLQTIVRISWDAVSMQQESENKNAHLFFYPKRF